MSGINKRTVIGMEEQQGADRKKQSGQGTEKKN